MGGSAWPLVLRGQESVPGRTPEATVVDDPRKDRSEGKVQYGPLSEALGFLLRLGQLKSFAGFFRSFEAEDIRPGELTVLMVLHENPGIRQGMLAKALSIKRAHMTKMVRQMEDEGLILRRVPEDDKRAMELWLTEAGEARVAVLAPILAEHESGGAAGLSVTETAELKRLLRKMLNIRNGASG
ncbi:MarR family transcriptional regulator [Mameliella alba]|nr:MarR family transcriptional regulator [Mameliella alba]